MMKTTVKQVVGRQLRVFYKSSINISHASLHPPSLKSTANYWETLHALHACGPLGKQDVPQCVSVFGEMYIFVSMCACALVGALHAWVRMGSVSPVSPRVAPGSNGATGIKSRQTHYLSFFPPKKTAYNEKAPISVQQEPVPLCCCCCCHHSYPWGLSLC